MAAARSALARGLLIGAVVIALLALAAWQVHDRVLVWALERAVHASEGKLQIEGVSGSLVDGLRVRSVAWQPPAGTRARLSDVRLRWRWPQMLLGRVVVSTLRVAEVTVELADDGSPPSLPQSLALPVWVELPDVGIDRLLLRPAGGEPVLLEAVTLAADHDPDQARWRIDRLAARSAWGAASLRARIGTSQPFHIDALAQADLAWQGIALRLHAGGRLGSPDVQLEARPPGAAPDSAPVLHARSEINWLAGTVSPVLLTLRGLRPAQLGLAGPQALIDGNAVMHWRPDGPQPQLSGKVHLSNREPARLDQQGLPLTGLHAVVHWTPNRWRLSELVAELPDKGRISGVITVDPARALTLPGLSLPGLQGELQLTGVQPALLHGALPAARLSGTARLTGQQFAVALSDAARGQASAAGRLEGDRLVLDALRVARLPGLGAASAQASGSLQLQAPWDTALQGRVDGLDLAAVHALRPGLLPSDWRGGLEGRWSVRGPVGSAAQPRALQLAVEVERGSLQGLPLRGRGSALLPSAGLREIDLSAQWGASRLRAAGSLGVAGEALQFDLDAPALAPLAALAGLPAMQGELKAQGSWQGSAAHPALGLNATLARWRMGGHQIAQASVNGQLRADQLSLNGQARGLQVAGRPLDSLDLQLEGSPAAHRGRVALRAGAHQLQAAADGAMQGEWSAPRWSGQLTELALRGPVGARLRAPVTLSLARDALQLGAAAIDSDAGTLGLRQLSLANGRWSGAGEARLRGLARLADALGLERPASPPDLDLDDLSVELDADLAGSGRDDLSGSLSLRARPPAGVQGVADAAIRLREGAMQGSLQMSLPTLAVVNRWIGPEWSLDGRLTLAGQLGGTLSAPRLTGDVRGEALRLEQRSMGWRLGAGRLQARFDGDRLRLDSLRLYSGQAAIDAASRGPAPAGGDAAALASGAIDLAGDLRAADRSGRFTLRAQAAPVPFGPGQRVVVSGEADVLSQAGRFEVKGKLRADEGLIELRGGDAPSLPDDMVVVGAAAPTTATAAAPARPGAGAAESGLRLHADLAIDLGEKLRVRGSGVDARLTGALALRGTLPEAPRAFGTVRVRDGSYSAYGQKLDISRGRVVFNGPIDNPALDLTALRPNLPLEVGVSLTGTVLSPRIRLVSRPEMNDADKLSWLVLGTAPDGAQTGAQTAALQAAAATLFGRNDGGLASALGLDVLTIRGSGALDSFAASSTLSGFQSGSAVPGQVGGSATVSPGAVGQNVVAIGKRLSSRLVVTYEQGLRGVWNLLRIQYDITNRMAIRAQTGSESAIDLLWRLSFD